MQGTLFDISEDHCLEALSLNERLVKNRTSSYFFVAKGKAMAPMILHNDILVVDRSMKPVSGDLIICEVYGEFLCRQFHPSPRGVWLRAFKERDIFIGQGQELVIFGVVSGLARDFKNDRAG